MADKMPQPWPFATVEDLRARWPDMPPGSDEHAKVLLEDASGYIMDVCPSAAQARPDTRKRVTCAVVKRAMEAAEAPAGVSEFSETTGPFQTSFKPSDSNLFLRKDERKALGGGGKAFSVDVAGCRDHAHHRPWCSLRMGAVYCSCGADLTGGEPLWEA
jgi:hypothetical protein